MAAPALTSLAQHYRAIRAHTERLCDTLEIEDMVVSSMPDVSPTKWHLAHTSFEIVRTFTDSAERFWVVYLAAV